MDAGPDPTITLDGAGDSDGSQSDGPAVEVVAFSTPVELHADYDLVVLVVGDVDSDGRPDIVAGGGTEGTDFEGYVMWFGRGGRSFEAPTAISPFGAVFFGGGTGDPGVLLADFNGDHLLDIAFSTGGDSHYVINLGGRKFSATRDVPYPSFMRPTTVSGFAAGDFNRDGYDDLIFGGYPNTNESGPDSRAFVDLADGKGGFQMPVAYGANTPIQLRTADLDLDGWVDVITWGLVDGSDVLFNDKGTFSSLVTPFDPLVLDISVVDMDGDGIPDIIGAAGKGPAFIKNLGKRVFGPLQVIAPLVYTGYCLAGDMNHDGRPDVVCEGSDRFFILFNQGGGKFAAPVETLKGIQGIAERFVVADLDGDGKPDIILLFGKTILIYYNDTP